MPNFHDMAKIRVDKEKAILAYKAQKIPLESVKIKKFWLSHALNWVKRGQDPKFHETFGGWGKVVNRQKDKIHVLLVKIFSKSLTVHCVMLCLFHISIDTFV